jgi:beta-lactamase superfamily II metal-dependent hydrolase
VKSFLLVAALIVVPATSFAQSSGGRTLDIYFIDVEGGQATLIVLPGRQTLLVDAGYAGAGAAPSSSDDPIPARDPQRILAVAKHAGVSRIDYLLVTHYHSDHVGGVPELSRLIPIDTFIDHGAVDDDAERVAGTLAAFRAYDAIRAKGKHLEPRPGDRLPLRDAEVTIVSTAGATISTPLAGAASGQTAGCPLAGSPAGEPTENPRSLGFVLQFGKFRFLDTGDLTGPPLFRLSCPSDRIGAVDVYLVAHHGGGDAADPYVFRTTTPRVAILNNGARKGGAAETFRTLHGSPPTETWQLHRSNTPGAENFPDQRIANLSEATAHWIHIRAGEDGSFEVTNDRTGATTKYPAR